MSYTEEKTFDGGFIFTGDSSTWSSTRENLFLIKTDSIGNLSWLKCYGGNLDDRSSYAIQTHDSGFVIVGYTISFGLVNPDVYIIRTDQDGNLLWSHTYGGLDEDYGMCIQETNDHGFAVTGYTNSFDSLRMETFLMKLDSVGNVSWTKTYQWTNALVAFFLRQNYDNGFVVSGTYGADEIFLMRTDSVGDTIWTKRFYVSNQNWYHGYFLLSPDSGFIMTGASIMPSGNYDFFLMKIDSSGDTLWTKNYGSPDLDVGQLVSRTADGGYLLTGFTRSLGFGNDDILVIKTNQFGDTLWTRQYGGQVNDYPCAAFETDDGGYLIGGVGNDTSFLFVQKIDSLGNAACNELNIGLDVGATMINTANIHPYLADVNMGSAIPPTNVEDGGSEMHLCNLTNSNAIFPTKHLIIFPNPTEKKIRIIPNAFLNMQVSISDCLGRLIIPTFQVINQMEIDCSAWAAGIYLVLVETENGTSVQKLIKQ